MASRDRVAVEAALAREKIKHLIGDEAFNAVYVHEPRHKDLVSDLFMGQMASCLRYNLARLEERMAALEARIAVLEEKTKPRKGT